MPSIIAGDYTTVYLPLGSILTVSGNGSVVRLPTDNGSGEPGSPVQMTGAARTFGPYAGYATFRLDCTAGSLRYTLAGNSAGAGVALAADVTNLIAGQPLGTLLATVTDPFAGLGLGATRYSLAGWNTPGLYLQRDGRILQGRSSLALNATPYIEIRATSGDGSREIVDVLDFYVSSVVASNTGPQPDPGFVLLTRSDGTYLTRADGTYLQRAA